MKKNIFITLALSAFVFCLSGCYDAIFQGIRDEVELEKATVSGFVNSIARFNAGTPADTKDAIDNQYLFNTNGKLYYKKASVHSHGAWNRASGSGLPSDMSYDYFKGEFHGAYIYSVVADADYVYVMTHSMKYDSEHSRNVPSDFALYYSAVTEESDGTLSFDWKKHDLTQEIQNYQSDIDDADEDNYGMALSIYLFGTNAPNPSHRHAFLRIGGGSPYLQNKINYTSYIYRLTGQTSELGAKVVYNTETTADSYEEGGADSGEFCYSELSRKILSAAWFGGKVHFMNYVNVSTNEGCKDEADAVLDEPTYVYFPYSNSMYSFAASDYGTIKGSKEFGQLITDTSDLATVDQEKLIITSVGHGISCMAVTNDALIVGTGGLRSTGGSASSGYGAFKIVLASGGKMGTSADNDSFLSNADSIMADPYIVRALICAEPYLGETAASMYSSLDYLYTESSSGTNMKNRGLWSYYAERGNWNRE